MGYYQGKGARLVWQSAEIAGKVQQRCPVTAGINMVSCANWTPPLCRRGRVREFPEPGISAGPVRRAAWPGRDLRNGSGGRPASALPAASSRPAHPRPRRMLVTVRAHCRRGRPRRRHEHRLLRGQPILRHVRLQPSPLGPGREEVDYRDAAEDPLDGKGSRLKVTANTWGSPPTNWPESDFVGEMYAGFLEPGLVVSDASSWVYRGTGLHDGSTVPGVIGSGVDRFYPAMIHPAGLQVLSHSPIPAGLGQTDIGPFYSDMTYYTHAAGARACWTPRPPTGFPRSPAGADAMPETGRGATPGTGPGTRPGTGPGTGQAGRLRPGPVRQRSCGGSPATSCVRSAPGGPTASTRRCPTGGGSLASSAPFCRMSVAGEGLLGPDDFASGCPPRAPALCHPADDLESPAALILVAGIPEPGQRGRIVQYLTHQPALQH